MTSRYHAPTQAGKKFKKKKYFSLLLLISLFVKSLLVCEMMIRKKNEQQIDH